MNDGKTQNAGVATDSALMTGSVCLVCRGKGKVMTLKPRSKKGWNPCVRCGGSGNATGKWARKPNGCIDGKLSIYDTNQGRKEEGGD